jgi:hypothetical protein
VYWEELMMSLDALAQRNSPVSTVLHSLAAVYFRHREKFKTGYQNCSVYPGAIVSIMETVCHTEM